MDSENTQHANTSSVRVYIMFHDLCELFPTRYTMHERKQASKQSINRDPKTNLKDVKFEIKTHIEGQVSINNIYSP